MEADIHTAHERELYDELKTLRTKYQETFEAVRQDEIEIAHLMDTEMPKYSKVIIKDAEALEAVAAKHEHDVAAQALREIELAELELVIFGGVGTLLAIVLSVGLSRGIARPVRGITGVMDQLSHGNLTVGVPGQDREDEIGEMATAVEVFKQNMIKNEEMRAE
ncbi:MAG: hypothetical protein CMM59_18800 [Rhodospirillaceae bacterium]|nr:hypothetical protein [Rhodospirillaceae bacterium]|tara:strand:- start:15 stop:506 length:492 start_codon:yes stop_codon:yes gene_type:complete